MASNAQIIILLAIGWFAFFVLGWSTNDIFGIKKAGTNQQNKSTENNIPKNSLKSKLVCCNLSCKYNGNGTCDRNIVEIGTDGACSNKWNAFDRFV